MDRCPVILLSRMALVLRERNTQSAINEQGVRYPPATPQVSVRVQPSAGVSVVDQGGGHARRRAGERRGGTVGRPAHLHDAEAGQVAQYVGEESGDAGRKK